MMGTINDGDSGGAHEKENVGFATGSPLVHISIVHPYRRR